MTHTHTYYSAEDIAALCPGAHPHTDHSWRAQCPVHKGDNPTALSISQGRENTLLYCFAHQCSVQDICAALGIPVAGLFMEPGAQPRQWRTPEKSAVRMMAEHQEFLEAQREVISLDPATGPQPVLSHGTLLGMLLDSLTDGDLKLLHMPEAQEILRQGLDDPMTKAIVDQRLKQSGHYPPNIYKLVGYGTETPQAPLVWVPNVAAMETIAPEQLTWMWWPYLAYGTIAMLDGDPGIGKSMLTLALATALSTGTSLPDQQGHCRPGAYTPLTSLFCAREDSLAHTVRPRLDALGADLSRIRYLEGMFGSDGVSQAFTLEHVSVLADAIATYGAKFVVLDPIQSYLGARVNMNQANETRPLLDALSALALQFQCCILCVRHPAKASGQGGGKAMLRGLGSVDFIGAARTGLFVEQHPLDATLAMMALTKSNIGPGARTQIYSKAHGHFQWAGVTRLDAELLAGNGRGPDPKAFLEAYLWLEKRLDGGIPVPASDVELQIEQELGTSKQVLAKARKALGATTRQTASGWEWRLPALDIHREGEEETLPPLYIYPPPPLHIPSTDYTTSTHSTDSTDYSDLNSVGYVRSNLHGGSDDREVAVRSVEAEQSVEAMRGTRPRVATPVPSPTDVCPVCGQTRWQTSVTPWRCMGCGARR